MGRNMKLNDLVKNVKNENLYYNLASILVESGKDYDSVNLVEGLHKMMTTMFNSDSKKSTPKTTPKKYTDDHEETKPFAGLCKSGRTILIPDNPEYRTSETKLVQAAAQMFRGEWVNNKDAQKCLSYTISFLLRKFLEDIDNTTDINLDIIGDALVNGHLTYATSHKDYKMVERVYERISYHRDSLINDLFKNPISFKESWSEIKNKLSTTIENILKTGGDITLSMGQDKAMQDDNKLSSTHPHKKH